jgi:predicted methyltransferase
MFKLSRLLVLLTVIFVAAVIYADTGESTRIVDSKQHNLAGTGRNQYRQKSEYVMRELDLRPGDVVVDIGAGDGWWARQMAKFVGDDGVVHAGEIEQKKVDDMKEKCADSPQVKPYLIPLDGTALDENSCDLSFISKTYHHFNKGGQVDYLRHLHRVIKPAGRLCIIERHPGIRGGARAREHGWSPGLLMQQAEEAGWIAVRCELITGTYHFIAIFVQNEVFPPEPARRRPQDANN